jgi:hypothetical protein
MIEAQFPRVKVDPHCVRQILKIKRNPPKVVSAFGDNETGVGDTVNKDWPIATANLTPSSKLDLAPFSVVSCLLRELPCLPSIEAVSLDFFHPFACPVLGVVPRT